MDLPKQVKSALEMGWCGEDTDYCKKWAVTIGGRWTHDSLINVSCFTL